jgi:hypothetical protein
MFRRWGLHRDVQGVHETKYVFQNCPIFSIRWKTDVYSMFSNVFALERNSPFSIRLFLLFPRARIRAWASAGGGHDTHAGTCAHIYVCTRAHEWRRTGGRASLLGPPNRSIIRSSPLERSPFNAHAHVCVCVCVCVARFNPFLTGAESLARKLPRFSQGKKQFRLRIVAEREYRAMALVANRPQFQVRRNHRNWCGRMRTDSRKS